MLPSIPMIENECLNVVDRSFADNKFCKKFILELNCKIYVLVFDFMPQFQITFLQISV